MSPKLASICADLGVVEVPTSKRRAPGETCAVKTMERILRRHGADHLRDVLMTLMETENNKRELTEPVLLAVSDILFAHPNWFCGEAWFEAVDAIDLAGVYEAAKANRAAVVPRAGVAAELFARLNGKFGTEMQGRLV